MVDEFDNSDYFIIITCMLLLDRLLSTNNKLKVDQYRPHTCLEHVNFLIKRGKSAYEPKWPIRPELIPVSVSKIK